MFVLPRSFFCIFCGFYLLVSCEARRGSLGRTAAFLPSTTHTQTTNNNKYAGVTLSWEHEVANRIREKLMEKRTMEMKSDSADEQSRSPLMVSVVGIPGSGKSTSAAILDDLLSDVGCMVMPFDGYHYTVDQLKSFPDPEDVIYRRGAPDTFDANSLKRDLERIRCGQDDIVKVPGFDHAAADPEPDAYSFSRGLHNIVLCEGLYLLHDQDGWEDFAAEKSSLFDLSIFVDADVDACVERLKIRNKCIPGYTPEEIDIRCEVVDKRNAMTVNQSKKNADLVVQSAAVSPVLLP